MKQLIVTTLMLALSGAVAPVEAGLLDPDSSLLPGFDYLRTLPGTYFVINGSPVALHGVPAPGGADTIVQRLQEIDIPDVIGATQTIGTQMTMLNLASDPGAGPYGSMLLINLTPGAPTLGSLTLTQTINGEGVPEGTFSSFFDVFFDIQLQGGGGVLPCDLLGNLVCHSELTLTGSGFWTDHNGQFLVGPVIEQHPGAGVHIAGTIPEPTTYAMLLTGFGLLGFAVRRRKQQAA